MRQLTDHIVSGDQAVQLKITVTDEPGAGGACHSYLISGFYPSINPGVRPETQVPTHILFQNGPIKDAGVNGITHEALLAIVIDRLRSFQAGPFACNDNAVALAHLEQGLEALQRRTVARLMRGVEGTHKL